MVFLADSHECLVPPEAGGHGGGERGLPAGSSSGSGNGAWQWRVGTTCRQPQWCQQQRWQALTALASSANVRGCAPSTRHQCR